MDQEMIAYFDEHFRKTESLHQQTAQQIAELHQRVEEQGRQIVDLRQEVADLRQEVADLRQKTEIKIRHTQILVEGLHDQIKILAEGFIGIEERLVEAQKEVAAEFRLVGHSIANHYSDLANRLDVVEKRTERQGRDPMDIIRERYGGGRGG